MRMDATMMEWHWDSDIQACWQHQKTTQPAGANATHETSRTLTWDGDPGQQNSLIH